MGTANGTTFDWRVKGVLSNQQIATLKALATKGMTRKELIAGVGSSSVVESIGKSRMDDLTLLGVAMGEGRNNLIDLGMVRLIKDDTEDGREVIIYTLTKKGEQAANWFQTRKRVKRVVPNDLLDTVVKRIKSKWTYDIGRTTDDDIKEVRDALGVGYDEVDITALREQIINRRKQGAFKEEERLPEWYKKYGQTAHWQQVRRKVLEFWDHRCALNVEHKDDVDVYHRAFRDALGTGVSLIDNESETDCIALCEECAKRTSKARTKVPDRQPS